MQPGSGNLRRPGRLAIENVRQFRELQTRLEREAATSGILEVISQSRDDDLPVFEVIRDRPVKPLWRIVWVVSYAALTA